MNYKTKNRNTILSTKKLSLSQRELLLNSGIGLVEYNAIRIDFQDFKNEAALASYPNIIFTSKNAAEVILKSSFKIQNCFCVGDKTKSLLEAYGQNVLEVASYGEDLAKIIVKHYKNESFLFFSGNLRRETLPKILKEHQIDFKEQVVYKTTLNSKKINRNYDGILFFSPSAVQSYCQANKLSDSIVFCIGDTTALEASKHTDKILIANKPSIENVIVQAVKYFA